MQCFSELIGFITLQISEKIIKNINSSAHILIIIWSIDTIFLSARLLIHHFVSVA